MPEDVDVRCNVCAQGFRIKRTDTYNKLEVKFCPICGTSSLKRETDKLGLGAACFTGINAKLVEMLYQNWSLFDKREDPNAELPARFIDYLKQQLEA